MNTKKLIYLFIGGIIICIDRLTKHCALKYCMDQPYYYNSFLSYELAINRGVSWGFFHSPSFINFALVSLVIAFVTSIVCYNAYYLFNNGIGIMGDICVISGSLSNLFDRIYYGGVIDFILVSCNGYAWPVFNIADMAIVIGVGIMIIGHNRRCYTK